MIILGGLSHELTQYPAPVSQSFWHLLFLHVITWPSYSLTILLILFSGGERVVGVVGSSAGDCWRFCEQHRSDHSLGGTCDRTLHPWSHWIANNMQTQIQNQWVRQFFVDSFGLIHIAIFYTGLSYNCSIVCFLISVRWKLGFPRMVIMHDVQHAAGPGVPEGPARGIRRAACSTGGPGNVCTDHRDRCVSALVSSTFAY